MYEYLIALGVPGAAAAVGVIRYFWKKEKCFLELKNTIKELKSKEDSSHEEHDGFKDEIDEIKARQAKNEIYLKLILKKFEIPYDD